MLVLAATLITGGVLTGAGPAAAASAATCPKPAPVQPPSPGTASNELHGVTIVSACSVWAVGTDSSGGPAQTLTEHWNGSAWVVRSSPNPGTASNVLNAASAASATDIWAVGTFSSAAVGDRTLIEHWDGSAWRVIPSPHPGEFSELSGVKAVSASDAWAVGFWSSDASNQQNKSLVLHWNGKSWARVASPSPAQDQGLTSVTATSASDAWAVGSAGNRLGVSSLILHWNGTKWSQVTSPAVGVGSQLTGVSATSASNAWAVGTFVNKQRTTDRTMTLHWDGSSWKHVASPNRNGTAINFLTGVAATSASNAWAIGGVDQNGTSDSTLLMRWNGTNWSLLTSPNPGTVNELAAVAATSASNVWAVGTFTSPHGQAFAIHCC
jgi:hypothetical protein